MIVFLNMGNGCLDIYTNEGKRQCLFSDIEAIKQIIGNEKVIYITSAQEATAQDVVEVIETVSSTIVKEAVQKDEKTYLRTTSKGCMLIQELDMKFNNPSHFVPLEELYERHGKDVFQEHPVLKKMLKNGQLQIVTESQAAKIRKDYFAGQKKRQSKQDKALDNIIVDRKIDDYIGTYEDEISSTGDDYIEIDVKPGPVTSTSNEGSLLPDDFIGAPTTGSNEGSLLPDDF